LGIGNCAQSPIPNPQSPIPNPHYNILYYNKENIILLKQNINNKFQNEYKISKEKKINKINIKGLAINKKRKYSQKDRIKNGKKLMNI